MNFSQAPKRAAPTPAAANPAPDGAVPDNAVPHQVSARIVPFHGHPSTLLRKSAPPLLADTMTDAVVDAAAGLPAALDLASTRMFEQVVADARRAVCITDPRLPDNPIVFVNPAFTRMTGYGPDEVLGRNCRFLQGKGTSSSDIARISSALRERRTEIVELVNYRKDGTPFHNALRVSPIHDEAGELRYFLGVQWDVSEDRTLRDTLRQQSIVVTELRHRVRNLFTIVSTLVRLTARHADDPSTVATEAVERIEALHRAHEAMFAPAAVPGVEADVRVLIETVLAPYRTGPSAERRGLRDRIMLDGRDVLVPTKLVTGLGLVLHELATNALKYGALAHEKGRLDVRWLVEGDRLVIDWREDGDGTADASASDASPALSGGAGNRIITGALGTIGAEVTRDWPEGGLHARIAVPLKDVG